MNVRLAELKTLPKLLLSKVTVLDMLDDNGLSLGDTIGSRKAFAVFMLDENQRNRLYEAIQYGKLMYEVYCDSTQLKDTEDFVIPPEFFGDPAVNSNNSLEQGETLTPQSGSNPDGGAN